MDTRLIHTAPLCQTCRYNQVQRFTAAGVLTEARGCERHVPLFPNAMYCQLYEREPGTDV